MNHAQTLIGVFLLTVSASVAAPMNPEVEKVLARFDELAGRDLWPGFDARSVPLAVYDGEDTWLYRYPDPLPGFAASSGDYVMVFRGRHPSIRANTSVDLSGVRTATAVLTGTDRSVTEQASLLIHEAFHVFQDEHRPDWSANEAELFVYPTEDADLIHLRRLETEALRRALGATEDASAGAWAHAALSHRRERFGRLPEGSVAYERGTELKEGLARYVQYRASRSEPAGLLPEHGFPVADVRQRGYDTGLAFALLLDRFLPDWRTRLGAEGTRSLDGLLGEALPPDSSPAEFSVAERDVILGRAHSDVRELVDSRRSRREVFLAQPGWEVVILTRAAEPLWPNGFDPLNIHRIDETELLHTRWLKLNNASGSLEILDQSALTESCGAHPLFQGVCRVTITGLRTAPKLRESEGSLAIEADGLTAEFRGVRVEQTERTLTVELAGDVEAKPAAP